MYVAVDAFNNVKLISLITILSYIRNINHHNLKPSPLKKVAYSCWNFRKEMHILICIKNYLKVNQITNKKNNMLKYKYIYQCNCEVNLSSH